MPTRRDLLATGAGLPLLLAGVRAAAADDLAAVNWDIALNHAAPHYESFARMGVVLRDALTGLHDGSADMDTARGAFWNTMDTWMAVQHLRLGPSQLDAREFRIEYWPDKRNRVDRQLAEALEQERADLLTPEGIAGTSVAIQGFPVLERLLFVDPVAPGSYGSALAASVGANLTAISGELAAAWSPGSRFLSDLLEPGSSDTAYADAGQVAGHMLTAIATQLEFVAQRKLMGPLGATPGEARPHLAESWRSGRSLRNVKVNVAALLDMFAGGGEDRFFALIADRGAVTAAEMIRGAMIASSETMAVMPDDLAPHVEDTALRDEIIGCAEWLDDGRRTLVSEGAPVLGLNLGFNSLDGD